MSLGDLTLDLTRMPRGAKSAKTCTLDMLKQDGSVPQVSFFKIKHMKGFWPFTVNTEEEEIELAVGISPSFPILPWPILAVARITRLTQQARGSTDREGIVSSLLNLLPWRFFYRILISSLTNCGVSNICRIGHVKKSCP